MSSTASLTPLVRRSPEGCCRPGRGCAVGAWVVTAPYVSPRSVSVRRPWGLTHVKRNGELETACGLPAVSWHSFFAVSFDPRRADACPACARRVHTEARGQH